MNDKYLFIEARNYLTELCSNIREECKYEKDGELFFERLSWCIQQNKGERLGAIEKVLGEWLNSDNEDNFFRALVLTERLNLKSLLPDLEQLYQTMESGEFRWQQVQYADLVENILNKLRNSGK